MSFENHSNRFLYTGAELNKVFAEQKKLFWNDNININQISTDTRSMNKGAAFVALKGEKYNGHDFIKNAILGGALIIIAEEMSEELIDMCHQHGVSVIFVANALDALTDIARYNRERLGKNGAKFVGITGTIGKTTVTQWAQKVMSKFFNTGLCVQGYNNQIGVSINLANSYPNAQVVVLEMGMDKAGEIEFLSSIVKPDVGIITNVTPVHFDTGGFKSIEEIADAKSEIFLNMNPAGIVILNQKNDMYERVLNNAHKAGLTKVLSVGTEESNFYIQDLHANLHNTFFQIVSSVKGQKQVKDYHIKAMARHQAFNILFIVALSKVFQLEEDTLVHQVKETNLVKGRGNIEMINMQDGSKITLINDTYNASPESVKMSMETLSVVDIPNDNCQRRVVIFGDMLDLGPFSEEYHKEIGEHVNNLNNIDLVFTIGNESRHTNALIKNSKNGGHYATVSDFKKEMKNIICDKDVVLMKASNGMKFDILVEYLYRM